MSLTANFLGGKAVLPPSPYKELIAYEYLCSRDGSTLKRLAEKLSYKGRLPSEVLRDEYGLFEPPNIKEIETYLQEKVKTGKFSVILKEDAQYPKRLLDAKYPIDLFYYRGDLGLLELPLISIVGNRNVSGEGRKRTKRLASLLCQNDYVIVSGLARGVDTIALKTTIDEGKKVIGVIGTPIDEVYPRENSFLQNKIAHEHLLISQVPFFKYKHQSFSSKKFYFPARNATMSAISQATVIVEASETSGTLSQARACIYQGRKLFILNSCFENPNITWPERFQRQEATRLG